MIGRAVLAGLSVLLTAWSAEGAIIYRHAASRPSGATVVLGGPAARPAAIVGGPAKANAGLLGAGGLRSSTALSGRLTRRSRQAAPASPVARAAAASPPERGRLAVAKPAPHVAPPRPRAGPAPANVNR